MTYVVLRYGRIRLYELQNMPVDSLVIAKIIEVCPNDAQCQMRNAFSKPGDFLWPENMFHGPPMPLSTLVAMSGMDDAGRKQPSVEQLLGSMQQ